MANGEIRFLCCVFNTVRQSELALEDLLQEGFNFKSISILLPDTHENSSRSLIRQLSYLRYFQIPSLGSFIGAGSIAYNLANWAVSGFKIPITELLTEIGVSELDAKRYFRLLKSGVSLFYMNIDDQTTRDKAIVILKEFGGFEISSSNGESISTTPSSKKINYQGLYDDSYLPNI